MPKIRPGEKEPRPYVTARLPHDLYKTVRELAIKHDCTIGEAFEIFIDKVRLEAQEQVEQLQAELEKVKKKLR